MFFVNASICSCLYPCHCDLTLCYTLLGIEHFPRPNFDLVLFFFVNSCCKLWGYPWRWSVFRSFKAGRTSMSITLVFNKIFSSIEHFNFRDKPDQFGWNLQPLALASLNHLMWISEEQSACLLGVSKSSSLGRPRVASWRGWWASTTWRCHLCDTWSYGG